MKHDIILINPWIYDFAAYDLWSKPLGLLYIAGRLRKSGFGVHFIDCMEIEHPGMKNKESGKSPVRRRYGTGKFWRQKIATPEPLRHLSRPYSRYGLSPSIVAEELRKVERPSAILVTSLMTYWYPGAADVISLVRDIHPKVPVILGGIYARLCREHAEKFSGADHVVAKKDFSALLKVFEHHGIKARTKPSPHDTLTYPAFEMLRTRAYGCILTSSGCPYKCAYCASHFLDPEFKRRDLGEVLKEILYWRDLLGVRDFAFYDDALLVDSARYLEVLLKQIKGLRLDLRFHTPNALHAREITDGIARLMYETGFRTIRLGLETADFSFRKGLDSKISEGEFETAVSCLLRAGFRNNQIGAYILTGLPHQSADSVLNTIELVKRAGAVPYLSEYSPIPHTALWNDAVECSSYDLESEPLFQNSTLLPCWDEAKKKGLPFIKKSVLEVRQRYR